MKNKLDFNQMIGFIDGVVDCVITNGFGYKQFCIDYFTALLYGEHDFGGTEENPRNPAEVYDELPLIINEIYSNIDMAQYCAILEAIDAEILHRQNLMYRDTSMSNSDIALTALINSISDYFDKFFANMGDTDIAEVVKLADIIKNNSSPDSMVKAFIDNGLAQSDKPNRKTRRTIAKTK